MLRNHTHLIGVHILDDKRNDRQALYVVFGFIKISIFGECLATLMDGVLECMCL